MAENMASKPHASGLERLPAPLWDGSRKAYLTWKKEFQHWMKKHGQDKGEQLQRFRKAMPNGSWWTEQLKACKNIDRAKTLIEILDIEFADERKLMDKLLAEIDNYGTVKGNSKSLGPIITPMTLTVQKMMNLVPLGASLRTCLLPVRYTKD